MRQKPADQRDLLRHCVRFSNMLSMRRWEFFCVHSHNLLDGNRWSIYTALLLTISNGIPTSVRRMKLLTIAVHYWCQIKEIIEWNNCGEIKNKYVCLWSCSWQCVNKDLPNICCKLKTILMYIAHGILSQDLRCLIVSFTVCIWICTRSLRGLNSSI